MKKVVFNDCYGGFTLSADALYLLLVAGFPLSSYELKPSGYQETDFPLVGPDGVRAHPRYSLLLKDGLVYSFDDSSPALRSHPALVHVVETLGDRASGSCARLAILELADDALYAIDEYDGNETVRVMSVDNYVAGYLMTPMALPEVKWEKPLLT